MLRTSQNSKINGDAVIAMISVGSLAIGYLIMNIFPTSSNIAGDIDSVLFGSTSILTLSASDAIWCGVLATIVIGVFIFFYNKIFAVTFDENFAKATGTRASAYNLLIAVVIAVVIVVAMNLVGSLLISALVVFPAISAMRIFKSFLSVTICSGVLVACTSAAGILISIVAGTPVGATIVVVDIAVFIAFFIIGKICRR